MAYLTGRGARVCVCIQVSSCYVKGSRLVGSSGLFSRSHTSYLIEAVTAAGVFTLEKRYSEVCDFHEQVLCRCTRQRAPPISPCKRSPVYRSPPSAVGPRPRVVAAEAGAATEGFSVRLEEFRGHRG